MIVVDLDGTVADCTHRLKYINGSVKDWNLFYKMCINDKPITPIIDLVKKYVKDSDIPILFLTGRSDVARKETEQWLAKYFSEYKLNEEYMLLMRKEGDYRPDYVVKPRLLDTFKKEYNVNVHFILEDRANVVKKWRELGYICLQVAEGEF